MKFRNIPGKLVVCAMLVFGCAALTNAKVVYVTKTGNNTNGGLSWAAAKQTVSAAITTAVSGDEIWVASGTYAECITITNGKALYGGFIGNETARSQRNFVVNQTVLDGLNLNNSVVTIADGAASPTIDGFIIQNGAGKLVNGVRYGGGVYCKYTSNAGHTVTIGNNLITNCSGGAIYVYNTRSSICYNTISGNTGAGVSTPAITDISMNYIINNTGNGISIGNAAGETCRIAGNMITGNGGSGISIGTCVMMILCNTIADNASYGLMAYSPYTNSSICNNITAFNGSYGVYGYRYGTMTFAGNDSYGNTGGSYYGFTQGTINYSYDPLFLDRANGDYHLLSTSPCIDQGYYPGYPGYQYLPTSDIDLQTRFSGATLDIGADEWM